jgi:predicted HTH transcriptional regulator
MSLWNKLPESIGFNDIDAFCLQKHKEGPLLDYKAEIPNELERLVSAFANTNGGLIVLGVAADPNTNEPIWPPPANSRGLPEARGIEERIVSICRDNIIPPILPQISPIIPNPHLPGHVLAVVRVDQSLQAPHAVNDGRRIYERTGSLTNPIDFAHIDRIQHLLARRQHIEADREVSIQRAIDRTIHQLSGRRLHFVQPTGP